MKKKVVIAGVVVAVIAVAAGISAMQQKPVEEEALIPVVNVENPQMGSIELYRSLVGKVGARLMWFTFIRRQPVRSPMCS